MDACAGKEDDAVVLRFDSGEGAGLPVAVVEQQFAAGKAARPAVEVVGEADHSRTGFRCGVVLVFGKEAAADIRGHPHLDSVCRRFAHAQSRQRVRQGVAQPRLEPRPHLLLHDPTVDDERVAAGGVHMQAPTAAACAFAPLRRFCAWHDDDGRRRESRPAGEREGQQRRASLWRKEVRPAHEGHWSGRARRRFRQCLLPAQDGRQPGRLRVRPQPGDAPVAVERLAEFALSPQHVAEPKQRRGIVRGSRHGTPQRRLGLRKQPVRTQQHARQTAVPQSAHGGG